MFCAFCGERLQRLDRGKGKCKSKHCPNVNVIVSRQDRGNDVEDTIGALRGHLTPHSRSSAFCKEYATQELSKWLVLLPK